MTNILLSNYNITKKWCINALKPYIQKGMRVIVVALSFGEEVSNASDWDKLYGNKGILSNVIAKSLKSYGIGGGDIEFINPFEDSLSIAKRKLENADIIYFPDGIAKNRGVENLMGRIVGLGLYNIIENHRGTIIGVGIGAKIQLSSFHIMTDGGKICSSLGFRFNDGFDIDIDEGNDEAKSFFIRSVVNKTGAPFYSIGEEGLIVIENKVINPVGDVCCYRKKETA